MNPFDLYGPQFLLFYVILSAATMAGLAFLRRRHEVDGLHPPQLDDPYLVAYLRGGESEALRIVMMSLVDRGLLKSMELSARPGLVLIPATNAQQVAARPIERHVIDAFEGGVEAREALQTLKTLDVCDDYASQLADLNLLPGAEIKNARMRLAWPAIIFLLAVAGIKIAVAASRGRSNVQFLIILAVAAAFLAYRVANPFRTSLGDQFIDSLKTLFAGLRGRADSLRPGGATSELAWLAAVFGLAAVPSDVFPQIKLLRLVGAPVTSSSSSCGSSCSGGCGSGCGGGCGGCGS